MNLLLVQRIFPAVLLISTCISALATGPSIGNGSRPPDPGFYVDLDSYTGHWYELYDTKSDSSDSCVGVEVTYAAQPDGTLRLLNQCRQSGCSGPLISIQGSVRSTNVQNTELKVRFDPKPLDKLEFNYWILWVDPGYQLALLGTPRSLGYTILSRTAVADPSLLETARQIARSKGYFDRFTVEIESCPPAMR